MSAYQAAVQLQIVAQNSVTNALKPLQGHHPLLDVLITVFAIQGTTELTQMMKGLPNAAKDVLIRALKLIKYVLTLTARRAAFWRKQAPKNEYTEQAVVKLYTPEKQKNPLYETVVYYLTHVLHWKIESQDPKKGDDVVHEIYLSKEEKVDTKQRATQARSMERPPDNVVCVVTFRGQDVKVVFGSETTKISGMNMQLVEVNNNYVRLTGEHPGILKELLYDAKVAYGEFCETKGKGRQVFTNSGAKWMATNDAAARKIETVILPPEMKEEFMRLLRTFRDGETFYADMGLKYAMKILLHGKPGCGKSSVAQAIAYVLNRNVYLVNLSAIKDLPTFQALMFDASIRNAVLVLDDVDTHEVFNDREAVAVQAPVGQSDVRVVIENHSNIPKPTGKEPAPVTLGTWLDYLDGQNTPSGLVVVVCTNRINVLDPAIVRDGRMNIVIEMKACVGTMVYDFFERFFPMRITEQKYLDLIKRIPDGVLTPCIVSNTFMTYRTDPDMAFAKLFEKIANIKEGKLTPQRSTTCALETKEEATEEMKEEMKDEAKEEAKEETKEDEDQ